MPSPLEVLWQTDVALAVNKPAGLPTQAPVGIESVESRLREQLQRQQDYLVFPHRLDRCVSGVLLVALRKRAARLFSDQFATRKTTKTYVALVHGVVNLDETWEDFVRKVDGRAAAEICREGDPGAKWAVTEVWTVRSDPERNRSFLRLKPVTGRMHQLRVQAAGRGMPILGDVLYGAPDGAPDGALDCAPSGVGVASDGPSPDDLAGGRGRGIALHAEQLAFHHPQTGKRLEVTAGCPFASELPLN
ncbi:RluA family pseudouridine synthase [Roseiconus nitratireducens]|uniref:RluA family pseudouridine synthase n=1 Tax=Roseiconus nitratireducens TaxID=2605748 RepID=A0A5M6DCW3_9BACT|nr:RluA family pseudouridine synthase [Roseiconus nitratireducens]KAA5545374.1 RluA family pseudouridine synthase [Roseiconus nitratireducens]